MPGAVTSGLGIGRPSAPTIGLGPRLEKGEMRSLRLLEATAIVDAYDPGELIAPADAPSLPAAATTTMPAASSASIALRYAVDVPASPQLLFTMSGASDGSAFVPARSVGASIQARPCSIVAVVPPPLDPKTFAWMNC